MAARPPTTLDPRPPSRPGSVAAVALLLALAVAPRPSFAEPASASGPAAASAPLPAPSLGPHAAALEGTWEFRSLTRPDGVKLVPPVATGVLVVDNGVVLAASYVLAGPERKVGSLWEGRMVVQEATFLVVPERGMRYDSAAESPVTPMLPPRSQGRVERLADGLRFAREDGGSITYEAAGRRVQRDADGTVIVHERTSLVPRVPDNLPGRTP